MKVAVCTETIPGERRVATLPDVVPLLTKAGLNVTVQAGAGTYALATDAAFTQSGATVAETVDPASADVLLHVRPLTQALVARLKPRTITLGLCSPSSELGVVAALRDARVTSFSMELVPRISRAQSMDALTSQALVAGYRCVLEAAMRLPRFFPMFMTAAGTVPPAKVLVLGAGVAGLQAIATAKRLGAVVSGYDVRAASADEVKSMGATFVTLELEAEEGAGGYAKEMTQDRAARQRDLLAPYIHAADVVITTASVPGRPAPRLVTADMLSGLKPGSVIIDLAAETGGNVEGSVPGEDITVNLPGAGTITIVGMKDAASTMPADASRLYAKNVANLLLLMTKDGEVVPDFDDEVVAGACLTHDGAVRHAPTAELLGDPLPGAVTDPDSGADHEPEKETAVPESPESNASTEGTVT